MADARRHRGAWILLSIALAVVFAGSGFAASRYQQRQRIAEHRERFQLLSELRRDALREYIETIRAEIFFWSTREDLLSRQRELARQWKRLETSDADPAGVLRRLYVDDNPHASDRRRDLGDAGDGSPYSAVHRELHPLARLFVVERGYYDFFLIDADGNVLYTVEKESDFATNLIDGEWKDTGLARVFRRALEHASRDTVAFSDFSRYPPSGDAPAMFAARAMTTEDGEVLGVFAMQLPTDRIQSIMHFTAGMGESGETYLVGTDLLMRSDSRFSKKSTILQSRVDTETVQIALKGESGARFTRDYRGVRVLSAYTFTDIDRIRWAVMAEIDEDEVLRDAGAERSLFSGALVLMYALSLLSAWFVRSGEWDAGATVMGAYDATELADVGD